MEQLTEFLRTHPVFASLNESTRSLLEKNAVRRELKKGETLVVQGDVWPYLFLVAAGELDAVKVSGEGRNLLVTTFGTGELFWGLAFFQDGAPLLATLEAHVPSRRLPLVPPIHRAGIYRPWTNVLGIMPVDDPAYAASQRHR